MTKRKSSVPKNQPLSKTADTLDKNTTSPSTRSKAATGKEREDVRTYDPVLQRRMVNERLYGLELINERFVRLFRIGLFNLLRKSPDVSVKPILIQAYHEFASTLPHKTNLNLVSFKPLRGMGLVVFSSELIFMTVDNLFGGGERAPVGLRDREFTQTEQRIIKRLLHIALEAYGEAWSSIYLLKMEYIRSELQIKFANITTSPNDIVITIPFNIEIGGLQAEFYICLPFNMLEPLRELLTNPPLENARQSDYRWRETLSKQIKNSTVELVVHFAELEVALGTVLRMKKQDIISLEPTSTLSACVDSVPVLRGSYGSYHGQYAFRVEEFTNHTLDDLLHNEDIPHE